jgi:SAM-dependent methyltransferase
MSDTWKKYLHRIRREEIDIAFSSFREKEFQNGLELGAGEGYQSTMLINYCNKLICTELNDYRLKRRNIVGVEYKICDAEKIEIYFDTMKFDLIFSSNMFEHLPNPDLALLGIKKILSKSGIVILIMPSSFWAICHIILHYPVKILGSIKRKLFNREEKIKIELKKNNVKKSNNLKAERIKRTFFLDFIRWPYPHGVSKSYFQEIINFNKQSWIKLFIKNGYRIIDIKKGPITSGYGLNLNRIRLFFRCIGLASEYIYYIKVNDS